MSIFEKVDKVKPEAWGSFLLFLTACGVLGYLFTCNLPVNRRETERGFWKNRTTAQQLFSDY